LLSVVRYIHLNPVHHKLTSDYKNFQFSSYRTILSDYKTIMKREDVINWFGNKEQFIEFHEKGKNNIQEDFYNYEID
jgi:uncharacterized ubiquitin-like protein YukD